MQVVLNMYTPHIMTLFTHQILVCVSWTLCSSKLCLQVALLETLTNSALSDSRALYQPSSVAVLETLCTIGYSKTLYLQRLPI